MFITSKCPCGKSLQVDESARGKKAKCPACGNVFLVQEVPVETTAVHSQQPPIRSALSAAAETQHAPQPIPHSPAAKRSMLPWLVAGGCGLLAILACCGCGGFWLLGAGYFSMGTLASSQKDTAALQLKVLTAACQAYRIKHDRYPINLQLLVVKDELGGPYVEKDSLVDPWGKSYQYDSHGPKNNGERPDIWTAAPDGTVIGNWRSNR